MSSTAPTRPVAVLAAGALLVTLGACSPGSARPTGRGATASAEPPGTTALLRQFRSDRVRRGVQVTVAARQPLHVTSVTLLADGFVSAGPTAVDADLPAGSRVDLPTVYGAAVCTAATGPARAVLGLADGADLTLPLTDDGLLARLHGAECAERAILAQVDLTVGDTWSESTHRGRPSLRGTVRITRRVAGGARFVLDSYGANIIFQVLPEPTDVPVLVLEPGQASGEALLELVPTRCDAHALTESKRTSLVNVYAALGQDAPHLLTITPSAATRRRLEAFAVSGCRAG